MSCWKIQYLVRWFSQLWSPIQFGVLHCHVCLPMGISVWLVFENHNDPARITQMMKTVSPFKLVSSRSLCLLLENGNQLEFLRFLGPQMLPQMLQAILACHIIRGRIPFEAPCHCFTWEKVMSWPLQFTSHSGIWAVGSNFVFNWMKGTCAGFTSKFHRKNIWMSRSVPLNSSTCL